MGSLLAVGYLALFAIGVSLAIKHRDKPAPLPAPGLMPGISNPVTWLDDEDLLDEILAVEVDALLDDIFAEKS